MTRLLPLVTALAYAGGAAVAYRATPKSQYGEAYQHVAMHLVVAAMAVLVAATVLTLAVRARTGRARRAARLLAAAWALLASASAVEAYGATLGNGYGENTVHDVGALLLIPSAVTLLLTSLLVVGTRGGAGPWPLRLALVVSAPAAVSLTQASSPAALGVCLAAAAVWAAVAADAAADVRRPLPLAIA